MFIVPGNKGLQIKINLRVHLWPQLEGYEGQGALTHCQSEWIIGESTMWKAVENSQKSNNESTICPSYIIPWPIQKGLHLLMHRYWISYVHCYFTQIKKKQKQPKCSSTDKMANKIVVYTK